MSGPRRCAVCETAEPFEPIYERSGFTLVRCPECALVFQHPRPGPEAMAALYYFSSEFAERLEGDLRVITVARAREKLPLLRAARVPHSGAALDVGCSSGAWLEVARDAGWQPTGIEIGEASGEAARRRGFEVHTGTLADAGLDGRNFDLITFWDVLEHLSDPLDALRRAGALLAPDGTIALTFPNVEGWYPRATRRLIAGRTGVWEFPELPAHLYDFSPSTAERLLRRAGLMVTNMTTPAIPFDHYRSTTLRHQLAGRGWRGTVLRTTFEALRLAIYPAARVFGRGNSLFVTARHQCGGH